MKINLEKIKISRKKILPGDIFVFKLKVEKFYRFGQVMFTKLPIGGFDDLMLIYLYKAISQNIDTLPFLSPNSLLLPPVAVDRRPWTTGYFQSIRHLPITKEDLLPQHHFSKYKRGYCDEKGNEVTDPIEPIGIWGLHSVTALDHDISDALGIPWAEYPDGICLPPIKGKGRMDGQS